MDRMDREFFETWDELVYLGVATNEELGLATALCGRSVQTLNNVLYIRWGYRSLEQLADEERESEPA